MGLLRSAGSKTFTIGSRCVTIPEMLHHVVQQRTSQTSVDISSVARFVIVIEILSVLQNAEFVLAEDRAPR